MTRRDYVYLELSFMQEGTCLPHSVSIFQAYFKQFPAIFKEYAKGLNTEKRDRKMVNV